MKGPVGTTSRPIRSRDRSAEKFGSLFFDASFKSRL